MATSQLQSTFRGTRDLPRWVSPLMLVGFFLASFFLQSALASGADSVE
ncbi:MAG: phosphate ABC transporter, permease protein PstA, partial [Micrococcales bacterium]|nr:phosphate ABC transporter, permease protein PstA [Micrococcales bacterium]